MQNIIAANYYHVMKTNSHAYKTGKCVQS